MNSEHAGAISVALSREVADLASCGPGSPAPL